MCAPTDLGQRAALGVAFHGVVKEEAGVLDQRPIGRALDGRYRIEAEIGAGGLGAVYRATHEKLDKSVAIKLLHQHCGASELLRGRFEREARALAALDHPNIVAVSDFGISDGTPYLVMELLEGETLADRMDRGTLEAPAVRKLARELLEALQFVHARGLVHRDVKPSNVFLQRLAHGGERVKILDFGLAKFMSAEGDSNPTLTRDGAVVGTPAYMSPEQASGDSTDVRSDVYATGVILFQLLAGRLPFEGDAIEQLRSHLVAPIPKLNEVQRRRVFRPEVDLFIERALGKRREERFRDAGAMLAALEALPEPWVIATATPSHESIAIATTQEMTTTASERLAAQSAHTRAQLERGRPKSRRLLRLVLLLGLLSASVFAGWQGGLWDMLAPMRGPKHAAAPPAAEVAVAPSVPPSSAAGALPVAEPTAAEPTPDVVEQREEVRVAVAEVAEGLAPVLQAAQESEAQLEQELRDREVLPPPLPSRANLPRPGARNPWARGALPRDLRSLRTAIQGGARGNDRAIGILRRYNREHGTDPRGHLLLAGLYLNREWRADAVNQFSIAYQRDPSSRGAPEMLRALLTCVVDGVAARGAERLIVAAYGDEAVAAIERSLRAHKDDLRAVARLQALRARIRGS